MLMNTVMWPCMIISVIVKFLMRVIVFVSPNFLLLPDKAKMYITYPCLHGVMCLKIPILSLCPSQQN